MFLVLFLVAVEAGMVVVVLVSVGVAVVLAGCGWDVVVVVVAVEGVVVEGADGGVGATGSTSTYWGRLGCDGLGALPRTFNALPGLVGNF